MSKDVLGAAGDLPVIASINFKTAGTLSQTIGQPALVTKPVGLVVFGDSSAIHLAQLADPGAGVYAKLPKIEAKTYIHGWTASGGQIYVVDGVELAGWNILTGEKTLTTQLLKDAKEVEKANAGLADLKKAIQRVEWATLLESAEDEWVRLTAQQSATPAPSAERDRLDMLATDFFRMLKSLREICGSAGGAIAARQVVSELRKSLAEVRAAVHPWCFSAPFVRPGANIGEPQGSLFVVQGNGTLYAYDPSLRNSMTAKYKNRAELHAAFLDDKTTGLKLMAYVGDGSLCIADGGTLADKGSWTPETPQPAGSTHTLTAANNQLWWGTDSGVYACQMNKAGKLAPPIMRSGPGWTTRQVGRLNAPVVPYDPIVNPNQLFNAMNVLKWLDSHLQKKAPLNDGILAQLTLSDASGKYQTPPPGTTYILHGPFARDGQSPETRWTQVKPHHSNSLVLLSDSRGASALCRYPSVAAMTQLVPQWTVAPWLASVAAYSPLDFKLAEGWPTPAVRPLTKPFPDMVARFHSSPSGKGLAEFEQMLPYMTQGGRKLGDRDLRFILWYALFNEKVPSWFFIGRYIKEFKKVLDALFTQPEQAELAKRFGEPKSLLPEAKKSQARWDYVREDTIVNNASVFATNFSAKTPAVNFDPPWAWATSTADHFHSPPPAWYDPWGYNRPGDFIPDQPSPPTYLDPFCFNGNLRFPQRPVTLDNGFKGRRWAVFTDNEPSLLLQKTATAPADTKKPLRDDARVPDPHALVITADEDRQRTTFQVLPPKQLRITFDAPNHTLKNEATEFGSIGACVLASPVVYLNPSGPERHPTAWCVVSKEFLPARLRKLALIDAKAGSSAWDKFLIANREQYGPRDGGKTWQIDLCPLPSDVLPGIMVHGYGLPAAS